MLKHFKTVCLALLCLFMTGIAMAEPYYKIQVLSESPYKFKYVLQNSPAPTLLNSNQTLVTTGIAPPVVQYYVRRQVGARNVYRYVKAVPNPVIPAVNQQIVTNPSTISIQQGFYNPAPPPGTPTPPPTTPQPVDNGTVVTTQFTTPPPSAAKHCAYGNETCQLPVNGVLTNTKYTVWYGNVNKWHKKSWQSGSIPCTNATFGGDPIPSMFKYCAYVEQYYLDRTLLDNGGVNLQPYVNTALTPTGNAGTPDARIRAATTPPQNSLPYAGAFRITCDYAFGSNDDPIVFPGVPSATHHHTFFGNTGVTAYSTNESLRASGNSTCAGGIANRSGYWMPSLIDTTNGAPMKPSSIIVYYKGADNKNGPFIKAPPAGLRMVSGSPRPATMVDAKGLFECFDSTQAFNPANWGVIWKANHIAQPCGGANQYLRMTISFPSCWDGKNLDSPDHISHMAKTCGDTCEDANGNIYNSANSCPASHPIAIPSIAINADFYNLDATRLYRLSSDNYPTTQKGGYSLHADWMNGWDQAVLQRIVTNCLVGLRDCGVGKLGDGEMLWGFGTD